MPVLDTGRLTMDGPRVASGDDPIPLSPDERRSIAGRLRDWNDLVRFCRATGVITARDERLPRDTRATREATPA